MSSWRLFVEPVAMRMQILTKYLPIEFHLLERFELMACIIMHPGGMLVCDVEMKGLGVACRAGGCGAILFLALEGEEGLDPPADWPPRLSSSIIDKTKLDDPHLRRLEILGIVDRVVANGANDYEDVTRKQMHLLWWFEVKSGTSRILMAGSDLRLVRAGPQYNRPGSDPSRPHIRTRNILTSDSVTELASVSLEPETPISRSYSPLCKKVHYLRETLHFPGSHYGCNHFSS
ncbi:hypothetical protein V8F33_001645 [Rhypophila sp. PSN 637]